MHNESNKNAEKTSEQPELSVVVLCYRSNESIIPFVRQMEKELQDDGTINYELVLVANYFPNSDDRTPRIVKELAKHNPKITVVALEKKGMMGWDLISGLRASSGGVIGFIDGDGQMPSKDIVRLYRVLKSGEFDLVKTYRKTRLDGVYRKFISFWYNLIFGLIFPGASFRDINAKPKMMTREAFNKMDLTCDGWFADGEIMLESIRLDLNVAEVPTVFHKNEWRGSLVKPWTILEFFVELARYRIKYWFK